MKQKPWEQAESEEIEDHIDSYNETVEKRKESKKIRKSSSSLKFQLAEQRDNQKNYSFRSFPQTLANSQRSEAFLVKRQDTLLCKSQNFRNDSLLKKDQDQQRKPTNGLFQIRKPRRKSYIRVSQLAKQRYLKVVQGSKDQTTQLNINIKTNIRNWFKNQVKFIDLSETELEILQNFDEDSACFQAFRNLFGCFEVQKVNKKQAIKDENLIPEIPFKNYEQMQQFEEKIFIQKEKSTKQKHRESDLFISRKSDNIRKLFLNYTNSTAYLKSIFQSYRMIFFSKRIVLKYVEQTRRACILPERFFSWKHHLNFQ